MIHAASLAHCDILYAWSKAENASAPTACLKGQIDKLQTELAQSQNQNRILMARFGRISPQRLPNYSPTERMEILAHKSACGWNLQQTAEAFMLSENTISSWMKRIDDEKLVSLPAPWNKYPDFLKGMAQTLKKLVPRMGKKKIAEYFARSGLYLAANTIAVTERLAKTLKFECPRLISIPLNFKAMNLRYFSHGIMNFARTNIWVRELRWRSIIIRLHQKLLSNSFMLPKFPAWNFMFPTLTEENICPSLTSRKQHKQQAAVLLTALHPALKRHFRACFCFSSL